MMDEVLPDIVGTGVNAILTLQNLTVADIKAVTEGLRVAFAGILGTDGIRRFINAGRLQNTASVLLEDAPDQGHEKVELLRQAERQTLIGAMETTAAAGLAGNYEYALTELSLVLTSALTYFRNSLPRGPLMEKVRSVLPLLAMVPLAMRQTREQLFIALGATMLGTAFRMNTQTSQQEAQYQKRSLFGGILYAIGAGLEVLSSPTAIGQCVAGWFTALNVAFAGSAARNLMSDTEKKVHLATPLGYDPCTNNGTINLAALRQQPQLVAQAIADAIRGRSLSGVDLTTVIMAMRFGPEAVGQIVSLQEGEQPEMLPPGQVRIVGPEGRIIFVADDPNDPDTPVLTTAGDNASPGTKLSVALAMTGFAAIRGLDQALQELLASLGYTDADGYLTLEELLFRQLCENPRFAEIVATGPEALADAKRMVREQLLAMDLPLQTDIPMKDALLLVVSTFTPRPSKRHRMLVPHNQSVRPRKKQE